MTTAPQAIKLSELAALEHLGQTRIYFEKDSYNDRICDQERTFCEGDLEARHQINPDAEEFIEYDRQVYQKYQPLLTRWIGAVERCHALLRPYFPTYNPWDDVTVDVGEITINLGTVGLIEWDLLAEVATSIEVINFCYSLENIVDTPSGMARQAFKRSRWNVLKATEFIKPYRISPKTYWASHISTHLGTCAINWAQISRLDIVRGINQTIDLLPGLEIPAKISRELQQLGLAVNPDGSERSGHWNHQNTFTQRYAIRRGAQSLAAHIYGVNNPSDTFDEGVVLEHKAFIDWHNQSLAAIGEADLKSIYGLYGIRWDVVQDILATLPNAWWITLGISPTKSLTLQKLREARNIVIKQAHPDKQGSEDWAKNINAAFETGKAALR